jgi:hypothetical protein
MASWTPTRSALLLATTGLSLIGIGTYWAWSHRYSFADSGSLASILGLILSVVGFLLTAASIAAAATEVRKTLKIFSTRLILGDVARAAVFAKEFRQLCGKSDWQAASDHADDLENALAALANASSLLDAERRFFRRSAQDVSLVSDRLRRILQGRSQGLDGVTWRSLNEINRELSHLEGRLRDLGGEVIDA